MNDRVEIRVNQSADELLKKYPGQFEVLKHPSGINFYTVRWRSEPYGKLVIGQPSHMVILPYILSAKGNEDSYFPDEHIINWDVNAGITVGDLIEHNEARQRFFGILQSLRNAGWVRAIRLSEPRLKGKDALHYLQTKTLIYSLDPDYTLSLDEWMSLEDRTTWSLYADHSYLDISITRDPSRNDVAKPGAYFVEYSLRNENERWRALVESAKRLNWKSELPTALFEQQKLRKSVEEELKKAHITIDETYRDPPLPDLSH